MKISELIKELRQIKKTNGDLDVRYYNQAGTFDFEMCEVLENKGKEYLALETNY